MKYDTYTQLKQGISSRIERLESNCAVASSDQARAFWLARIKRAQAAEAELDKLRINYND